MIRKRTRKSEEESSEEVLFNEIGYDFTKTLLDIQKYVSEPIVLYEHEFVNSTEDWCERNPKPKLFVTSKTGDNVVYSVGGTTNEAILSILDELKKLTAQNNATTSIIESSNKAILSELQKVSANEANLSELQNLRAQIESQNNVTADTIKAILTELQSIKASQMVKNATTANSNYHNNVNVTEFLNFIKRNQSESLSRT